MFSAINLLVLACACAVSVNANCTYPTIGDATNVTVLLPTEQFVDQITNVVIPVVSKCVHGMSGLKADVCDQDLPTAYFLDFDNLFVKRNGSLDGYIEVTVIVYCNTLV